LPVPLAPLAHLPLPRLRLALAQRQCAGLRVRLEALQRRLRQALAGPLAGTRSGGEIATAFAAFQRELIAHLRAEARVLRGEGVWSETTRASRTSRRHDIERMVREHHCSEERIDALRAAVARALEEPPAAATLRPLMDAVDAMEAELHEQIFAENQALFIRLRALL
jgi:iron-sulfur cluster repair protein YtfE (RIC family)